MCMVGLIRLLLFPCALKFVEGIGINTINEGINPNVDEGVDPSEVDEAVDLTVKSLAEQIHNLIFAKAQYNSDIRPIYNDSNVINVNVYLELLSIHDLDEKSETFKVTVYMHLRWTDQFITWNETLFNVVSLTLSQRDVWTPELVLTNSYERYQSLGEDGLKLMIAPDGTVSWETIEVLTSTCRLDTTYFPFDIQTCDINFVVWNYFREDVMLIPNVGNWDTGLGEFEGHPTWELISLTPSTGNLRKASIRYTVTMKRKALYYIMHFVLPTVMLTLLNVMTFVLPHDCGERASYAITVFLSMVVMLTILMSMLPESSNSTCIFGLYLIIETGVSTLITVINVLLIRASKFTADTPIPACLRAYVNCCRKSTIASENEKKHDVKEFDSESILSEKEENCLTWRCVVRALDKACFVFFFIVSSLATIVMLFVSVTRPSA